MENTAAIKGKFSEKFLTSAFKMANLVKHKVSTMINTANNAVNNALGKIYDKSEARNPGLAKAAFRDAVKGAAAGFVFGAIVPVFGAVAGIPIGAAAGLIWTGIKVSRGDFANNASTPVTVPLPVLASVAKPN